MILCLLVLAFLTTLENGHQPQDVKTVTEIKFIGLEVFDPETVGNSLNLPIEGEPFNEKKLAATIEKDLKAFFDKHGYLQAEIKRQRFVEQKQEIRIEVEVKEGLQYYIGEIGYDHSANIADEEIRALFDLHVGDVANLVKINQANETARQLLAEKGVHDERLYPSISIYEGSNAVDIHIVTEKTVPRYIEEVAVEGFEGGAEKAWVLSLLSIQPGMIFSPSLIKKSIEEINELGLFQEIDWMDCSVKIPEETLGRVLVVFWLTPK